MRKIDEAIRHCREAAEEHLQLAEWLEELKESREWRTPKKPKRETNFHRGKETAYCPNCGVWIEKEIFMPNGCMHLPVPLRHCPNCGQRLDWSEEK